MRKLILALAVATMPITTMPMVALADEKPAPDVVDKALEEVMGALRYVLRAIPQYYMPEVLPNGDIIIRRIPPAPEPKADPPAGNPKDGTRT